MTAVGLFAPGEALVNPGAVDVRARKRSAAAATAAASDDKEPYADVLRIAQHLSDPEKVFVIPRGAAPQMLWPAVARSYRELASLLIGARAGTPV